MAGSKDPALRAETADLKVRGYISRCRKRSAISETSKKPYDRRVVVASRVIVADRGDAGRRLDLVIRRHLSDVPRATRTRVQTWIGAGRVTINGRIVRRASVRAALGDSLEIALPDDQQRREPAPESGALVRLYEDEHLLIVDKPPGVVSHPTYRHPTGSLLNVVLWYARDWAEGSRPSLVGRLDKLTSGVVLMAKSAQAHARLQRTLASPRSEKIYLAVVHGPVDDRAGTIDLALRRDPADRRRVVVADTGGLRSVTMFERLDRAEACGSAMGLMQCCLVTGRMHQVRVHLAARGWPIVADRKYGAERTAALAKSHPASEFSRQALHAWRLRFAHPFSDATVDVEAPLPADMRGLIDACGLRAPAP